MERMAAAVVLVGVCLGSGMTPAFAEEKPDGVVEAIVADTAPTQVQGDELVAQVGDVHAEIPVDPSEPLTLQSASGPEISITLPHGDDSDEEPAREGSGAISHDLGDGSRIVPAIRSNGIVQILSVLHDAGAPTSFDYDVAVGTGGSLVAAADGGVRLLDGAGQEVASVAAPWAVDALGTQVPTRFVLEQNRLTQVVDTASVADVQYPVVADPAVSVTYTQYRVVDVSKTTNWTNRAEQIGLCKIERGGGGGQCTIAASKQVATSIGVSLGASIGEVATGLNFSVSNSRTVSVSWTSPPSPVGSSYKAWATGTRATYRVQKWVGNHVLGQPSTQWRLVGTSGTLTAFTPNAGFAIGQ